MSMFPDIKNMVFSKILYFFLFPVIFFSSCHQGGPPVIQLPQPVPVYDMEKLSKDRSGIYSGGGKNNELIAAAEAAIGELYYSFCELGENVEERIQAGPQRTVSGNVVHGTSG